MSPRSKRQRTATWKVREAADVDWEWEDDAESKSEERVKVKRKNRNGKGKIRNVRPKNVRSKRTPRPRSRRPERCETDSESEMETESETESEEEVKVLKKRPKNGCILTELKAEIWEMDSEDEVIMVKKTKPDMTEPGTQTEVKSCQEEVVEIENTEEVHDKIVPKVILVRDREKIGWKVAKSTETVAHEESDEEDVVLDKEDTTDDESKQEEEREEEKALWKVADETQIELYENSEEDDVVLDKEDTTDDESKQEEEREEEKTSCLDVADLVDLELSEEWGVEEEEEDGLVGIQDIMQESETETRNIERVPTPPPPKPKIVRRTELKTMTWEEDTGSVSIEELDHMENALDIPIKMKFLNDNEYHEPDGFFQPADYCEVEPEPVNVECDLLTEIIGNL